MQVIEFMFGGTMKQVEIFDATLCALGEGPIWHPLRKSLIWFDIMGKQLLERDIYSSQAKKLNFDDYVSAAGWINENELLMATSSALVKINIDTGDMVKIVNLEEQNNLTRCNDGRTDPYGGFWIGTMGIKMEQKLGAIYRYYKGELRKLFTPISIPNSICFSPCGKIGYFTDTVPGLILRVELDSAGWPKSKPEVVVDCRKDGLNPDGSVVDQDGCIWNAQWGASRVARYSPNGELLTTLEFDVPQTSCPEFGGDDLSTLFVTSASVDLSESQLQKAPMSGALFSVKTNYKGQKAHQILLS